MPKKTFHYGTRRDFLKSSSAALAAAAVAAPYFLRAQGANDRVRVACVGVGGKGGSDCDHAFGAGGDIVAICDVDSNNLTSKDKGLKGRAEKESRTYDAKTYGDWRKMFDQMGDKFDAITISTPDHLHGLITMRALSMGKHVYTQKPLCQTVWECREVRRLAQEKKVATQMGNQGSAGSGLRRSVEVIQSGLIGDPTELHVWSNRPIWPQGIMRPPGEDPVPGTLDWDLWLGPAAFRPYKNKTYHDFAWRGWYDFGTGALGDMACHTVNMPFRALKLGYPNVVELEMASRIYPETFPLSSRIRFEFPEREGLPPLKFWWYDGNPRGGAGAFTNPCRPATDLVKEIVAQRDSLPVSGCLVVGTKGKIFAGDDYGSSFQVMMKDEKEYVASEKHEATKAVPESIPRRPTRDTDFEMKKEWFEMMKGQTTAFSNFDIAAFLTETILLGCIALRSGVGHRLEWDGPNMRATNAPEAAQFVRRQNRKGWEA